jgi:hypothetical protein
MTDPGNSLTVDALVFDAYGTLFDVHSVTALAEALAAGHGTAISQLWRTTQLEYTWLTSLMASPGLPRTDFGCSTHISSWSRFPTCRRRSPGWRRDRDGSCRTARSRCWNRW